MVFDAKKAANVNAGIWFCHDAKEFDKVAKNAAELFVSIGYEKNTGKCGKLVAKAYDLYDRAWESYPSKQSDELFKQGLEVHKEIRKLFGKNEKSGYLQHRWWVEFGLKRYWHVFFWLCLHHFTKLQGLNFYKAIKASYLLGQAGLKGHDERSIVETKRRLEIYWNYINQSNFNERLIY